MAPKSPRRTRINHPCVVCGEPVTRRHPSRGAPKTCSEACARVAQGRRGERTPQQLLRLDSDLPLPWGSWSLLDTQGVVAAYIVFFPGATMREVSRAVGLAEGSVTKMVRDLTMSGTLNSTRSGKRKSYSVNRSAPFPHPVRAHLTLGDVQDLLVGAREADAPSATRVTAGP
jgi:hypothetical protein